MFILLVVMIIIIVLIVKNNKQGNELLNLKIEAVKSKLKEEYENLDFYEIVKLRDLYKSKIKDIRKTSNWSLVKALKNDFYIETYARYLICYELACEKHNKDVHGHWFQYYDGGITDSEDDL